MIPNNIRISEDGMKFRLVWVGPIHALGYLVCAARDSEFTMERRCFYIPCMGAAGVSLDMGGGTWFFRIATIASGGRIHWSNIYGPYMNMSAGTKLPPPLGANPFKLIHKRPIQGGVRAHIQYDRSAYIMILESSRFHPSLRASETEWSYHIDDVHRGSVDILNLEYPHNYHIRCTLIDGPNFPTDRIVPLGEGIQIQSVPEKPIRYKETGFQTIHRSDTAILRDIETVGAARFLSHADYVRYQAARARTGL
jgi:hypothetical protein